MCALCLKPMDYHCGVFVLYRWPDGTPWDEAPAFLDVVQGLYNCDAIPCIMPLGFHREREMSSLRPKDCTACMIINVSVVSESERDLLQSLFANHLVDGYKFCRFNHHGTPCSVIAWLLDHEYVLPNTDRHLEVRDLVDRRSTDILVALSVMIDQMAPYLTSQISRKRRKADEVQLNLALNDLP